MSQRPVIVIGGGFSGVFAARALHRRFQQECPIELISTRNHFVFQPLLPEVAAGIINIQDAVSPLRSLLKGVKVRMAEVQDIDFDNKTVHYLQGRKRVPLQREYDQLVLACGLVSDFSRFEGFTEHTLGMKHLADAYALRNRVISCLEHADATDSPELKRSLLTFIVIGGGFSGVETVGEMAEMLRRTLRFYPTIAPSEVKIMLVQRDTRILPELSESLSEYATGKLSNRGIEILCNTGVNRASTTGITLDNDTFIAASTVVTTIGNGPTELVQHLNLPKERGRILVDRQLRVKDRDDVWALGDAALIPMNQYGDTASYAPPTAQFAVQEAKCLAENMQLIKNVRIPKPFDYSPRGALASIGNYRAVAEVFGHRISGLLAWILWRGFYLAMLPGVVTRLRVALNWLLDYFIPRSIVQVDQLQPSSCRYIHLQKDSLLFRPNELVDGFYTVVEGELESRVKDPESGKDYVRVLKPGDHWGERVISRGRTTVGQLKALSNAKVLVLNKGEFSRLKESFEPLNKYLDGLGEENYPPQLRVQKESTEEAAKDQTEATASAPAEAKTDAPVETVETTASPKTAGKRKKTATEKKSEDTEAAPGSAPAKVETAASSKTASKRKRTASRTKQPS